MTEVSAARLRRALAFIRYGSDGPFVAGSFEQLYAALIIERALDRAPVQLGPVSRISTDLKLLLTIIAKLEWMKAQELAGHLDQYGWMFFAASDVDAFHMRLRSAFDHVAALLGTVADQPGTTSGSFHKLQNATHRSDQRRRIGESIARLIEKEDWFEDLRGARDDLSHRGAEALVFPGQPGMYFDLLRTDRARRLEVPSELRPSDNENIADLRLYCAYQVGYVVTFLEDVAEEVARRVPIDISDRSARHMHFGLGVLADWLQLLLTRLEDPADQ